MAQKYFHVLELWRIAYQPLLAEIGNKPVVVIVSTGFASIYEYSEYLKENSDYKVIWMSPQMKGLNQDKVKGIYLADLTTIITALRLRGRMDNVVFMMVHAACTHTAPEKVKRMLPGAKVISSIYDFMNIFVPKDKIHLWEQYVPDKSRAREEYAGLEQITQGRLVDGLLYKDYGPDLPFIKPCEAAYKLWLPPVLPKRLFQPMDGMCEKDNFVYIGTIVPKETHGRKAGLFEDIMMEHIFRDVTDQGYPIDAFVLNTHPEVEKEYKELFPEGTVRVFKGRLLGQLLPALKGHYHWGWMLYYWSNELIMEHIRISIPTKIFTYIALGIPPVVSEEFESVVRIVDKYKCGVVCSQKDIKDLKGRLAKEDYAQLQRGMLNAREDLCVEYFKDKFVQLVKNVMITPAIILEDEHEEKTQEEKTHATPTTATVG